MAPLHVTELRASWVLCGCRDTSYVPRDTRCYSMSQHKDFGRSLRQEGALRQYYCSCMIVVFRIISHIQTFAHTIPSSRSTHQSSSSSNRMSKQRPNDLCGASSFVVVAFMKMWLTPKEYKTLLATSINVAHQTTP